MIDKQKIEKILTAPDPSKIYMDDSDTRFLIWHSSDDASTYAGNLMSGGFNPGKKYGAMYGKGLYTNISPCQVRKCSYGKYIHVFSVKNDDKFKDYTLIGDTAFYKWAYGVDKLPEDWFIAQIKRKVDAGGLDIPVETMDVFTKFNQKGLDLEDRSNDFHLECVRTANWFSANYMILKTLGITNIVYWGECDHLCLVLWRPLLFIKYEGLYVAEKLQHSTQAKATGSRKKDEGVKAEYHYMEEGPQQTHEEKLLSRKLEAILMGFNGSTRVRAEKMKKKISPEERAALIKHIQEKFVDSKWTDWRPKVLEYLE